MMPLVLTVVDAFTDRPFTGNPAAVAVVDAFPPDDRMQAVANELNLSETAFVVPRSDGHHDLRWFSPTVEVDLCGHATLAAAHLFGGAATFHTRSGVLACTRGDDGRIEMDFPADPPRAETVPPELPVADVRWFGRGRFDVLIEVGQADEVRSYQPDLASAGRTGLTGGGPHRPGGPSRRRLCQPGVRAERRHPRGPGDGVGPLLPGGLLGWTHRKGPTGRPSGLPPGRRGPHAAQRRPGRARGKGGVGRRGLPVGLRDRGRPDNPDATP